MAIVCPHKRPSVCLPAPLRLSLLTRQVWPGRGQAGSQEAWVSAPRGPGRPPHCLGLILFHPASVYPLSSSKCLVSAFVRSAGLFVLFLALALVPPVGHLLPGLCCHLVPGSRCRAEPG